MRFVIALVSSVALGFGAVEVGEPARGDAALHEAVGLDTLGLERELQREILSEFPELVDVE